MDKLIVIVNLMKAFKLVEIKNNKLIKNKSIRKIAINYIETLTLNIMTLETKQIPINGMNQICQGINKTSILSI